MSRQGVESATSRVQRLLTMVPWLVSRQGIEISAAAAGLGISEEQLTKDLDLLFMCGYGQMPDEMIEASYEGGRVFVTNADAIARPLRLTVDEAISLIVGLRSLAASGAGDSSAVERALAKLEEATGAIPGVDRVVVVEDDTEVGRTTAALRDAVTAGRRVHLSYVVPSRDERTERDVDPMRLAHVDGHWYLEGWCHRAQDVRLFRVDRIEDLEVLDVPARLPEGITGRDLSAGAYQASDADLPVTDLFAAYAIGSLLRAVGITPGGLGVAEAGIILVLASWGADQPAAAAGALLFAIFTHVAEIPLGALNQSASAFGAIQSGLSFFRNAYDDFTALRASIIRLDGLADADARSRTMAEVTTVDRERAVALSDVDVKTPSGDELISALNLSLAPGAALVVKGRSGSGKTTLLRGLAGLWPFIDGEFTRPPGEHTLFLSQMPYIPLGDLRTAVAYPALPDDVGDEAIKAALEKVGPQTMLTDGIAQAYREGAERMNRSNAVKPVLATESRDRSASRTTVPLVLDALEHEAFEEFRVGGIEARAVLARQLLGKSGTAETGQAEV
mgnify:CR=1 FL=1